MHGIPRASLTVAIALLAVAGFAPGPAQAQTACRTPNCALGAGPSACQSRAAVRTPRVLMTTSGINFVFDPSQPRIEPGDCIEWFAATVTHSSSQAGCPDDALCGSPSPPACLFDSGNVQSGTATPSALCHYDPGTFPAATAQSYYCRIHATPTTGTMRGTVQVTTAIALAVDKSGADAALSWTGGGVAGDETFKVARSAADPRFPAATTQTLDPDGGVTGRSLKDVGALSDPTTRYYLVRNKQTNE